MPPTVPVNHYFDLENQRNVSLPWVFIKDCFWKGLIQSKEAKREEELLPPLTQRTKSFFIIPCWHVQGVFHFWNPACFEHSNLFKVNGPEFCWDEVGTHLNTTTPSTWLYSFGLTQSKEQSNWKGILSFNEEWKRTTESGLDEENNEFEDWKMTIEIEIPKDQDLIAFSHQKEPKDQCTQFQKMKSRTNTLQSSGIQLRAF